MTDPDYRRREFFNLKGKFLALRAAILSYLSRGVPDTDHRIIQARHQQRMTAEEMVRKGYAKGVAFEREGDYHREQRMLARLFDRKVIVTPRPREELDLAEGEPAPQIVHLKPLSFRGENGMNQRISPPKSQAVGLRALRMEAKVASSLNRDLSALEGRIGVDYEIDVDPESGITFYRPLGGKDG